MIPVLERRDEFVALTEGARQSGLTRETLAKYAKEGIIEAVWIGGRRLLIRQDFERFLRERRAARR